MIRQPTIHEKDIILDKTNLKEILDNRGMEYIELHDKVTKLYGLSLSYKGFMSLLQNNSTWKLLYAHAICEILKVPLMDIFKIVKIDKEKVLEEKKEWKKKYQK